MPCAEYERLEKDWREKSRIELLLYTSRSSEPARLMIDKRKAATHERARAEMLWTDHIKACGFCKTEGERAWEVDPRPITS